MSTTQTVHPWRATLRTVFQALVALAAAAPLLVAAVLGDGNPAGGFLVFLAASAAVTRLMAVPVVNDLLSKVGLGAAPKGVE